MSGIAKVVRLTFVWLVLATVAVACGEEPGPQVTAPVTSVTVPTTPAVEATVTEVPVEPLPPTPTAVSGDETPAATQAPATRTEAEATAETTPDGEVTRTATATVMATAAPITSTERFAPGQQATVELADGEFAVFPFSGVALETLLFFAEPDEDLNVDLAVYEADVTAESNLSTLEPLVEASAGAADVPEVLVFVPDDDGDFSLVVRATGSGEVTIQAVDTRTGDQSPNILAAGEVWQGASYNNVRTAVFIFVIPSDQSDLVLRARTPDDELITEANYGGPGSAEAMFVLPPQSAGFNFEIAEATGMPAQYHLFVYTPGSTPDQ